MKLYFCLAIVVLATASIANARHVEARGHKQARVFPGAITIKKLVLLKFKKIVPISLILLKSSNENEAELVPVYPTSEIPSDVQFIPTPNGISGHKDVQAIAVPSEFHMQLQANGLTDLEGIGNLLNESEANEAGESTVAVAEPMSVDDELLNVRDDDEEQLLNTNVEEKPVKVVSASGTRRLAVENLKTGVKAETIVEEIPIYLYSTTDNNHIVRHKIGGRRTHQRV